MADHTVTVESTLEALLVEKKYSTIRDILSTMNPADIASVFDGLEESRLPLLFRLLPKELAAETFVEMEPDAQELLIRGFSDSELREVLDELYVDDAVDIVEEMPANVVRRILSQADPDMRKDINEILRYPENSAGSIMTTEYVSLRPGMTVEEAILRIRRTGVDKETIYTCYVTKNRTLIGLVSVKDLLLAQDDDETVDKIMETNVISVHTHTDLEIQLPCPAGRGHGEPHGRHRDLRRRHGRHGRRGHGGHGDHGRHDAVGQDVSPLVHVRPLQAPHSLAHAADGLGHVHGPDHHAF